MKTTKSTSDSTAPGEFATTDQPLEAVCDQLAELTDRVDELETELAQKDERITELESKRSAPLPENASV